MPRLLAYGVICRLKKLIPLKKLDIKKKDVLNSIYFFSHHITPWATNRDITVGFL